MLTGKEKKAKENSRGAKEDTGRTKNSRRE